MVGKIKLTKLDRSNGKKWKENISLSTDFIYALVQAVNVYIHLHLINV